MHALISFVLTYWWAFFVLWAFGVYRGIGDFVLEALAALGNAGAQRHRRRMRELKMQAKIARGQEHRGVSGACRHRAVTPVISLEDKLVAWLCKGCGAQLPANAAVREEDL